MFKIVAILTDIIEGIKFLINFFIDKSPKAVKILFFLLFLLFFGNLINFMLQMSGIHCDSDKEPQKISMLDFGTNVKLLRETNPDRYLSGNELTICEAHPSKCGEERSCYYYMYQLPTGGYGLCNETNSSANCEYYLNDGSCHNCTYGERCIQDNEFWIFCGTYYDVCLTDAYYGGQQVTDFLTKCIETCDVPLNYVWNMTTGTYHCLDLALCGNGVTPEQTAVDEILTKAGATHLYGDSLNDNDYRRAVSVKCNNNLNPRLTFFKLDIFDYKMWLVLIVLYVMFIFLTMIKRH